MAGHPVNCLKLGLEWNDVQTVMFHIETKYNNLIPKVSDLLEDSTLAIEHSTCRLTLALIKVIYGLAECTKNYQMENIENSSATIQYDEPGTTKSQNEIEPASSSITTRKR